MVIYSGLAVKPCIQLLRALPPVSQPGKHPYTSFQWVHLDPTDQAKIFFFFFLISLFSYFRIFLFSCFLILGNGSCRPALSPASPTAACRGGALVSSALPRSTPSAQDNCCTRLTSSVSSVAMALPIS